MDSCHYSYCEGNCGWSSPNYGNWKHSLLTRAYITGVFKPLDKPGFSLKILPFYHIQIFFSIDTPIKRGYTKWRQLLHSETKSLSQGPLLLWDTLHLWNSPREFLWLAIILERTVIKAEIGNSVMSSGYYFGLLVFHISADNFIMQKTLQLKYVKTHTNIFNISMLLR